MLKDGLNVLNMPDGKISVAVKQEVGFYIAHYCISVIEILPAVPACSTAIFWPGVTVI